MINPFNIFYDTSVDIYSSEGQSGYDCIAEKTFSGSVICDIQPVEDCMEPKMYGQEINREYKLFCDSKDFINEGGYALCGGRWYRIVSVQRRKLGMSALLRLCADEVI